jgi:hypothetical protein
MGGHVQTKWHGAWVEAYLLLLQRQDVCHHLAFVQVLLDCSQAYAQHRRDHTRQLLRQLLKQLLELLIPESGVLTLPSADCASVGTDPPSLQTCM